MNFSMWGQALRGMPRPTREEWDRLDLISRWLVTTRAAVLLMTLTSAGIGGLCAWRDGFFDISGWLWVAAGLLLAHATNNLLNDLIDHKKGVDKDNYFRTQYGPQPLAQGLLSPMAFAAYVAVTGGAALAIGLTLAWTGGEPVWWLLTAGVGMVIFYTWPLKYLGLGEPAVLAVWGPLMVGGTYQVLVGEWSWVAAAFSMPYALGVTGVLFGKHIDKLESDQAKGIRTLPVILGHRAARYSVIGMMVVQYLAVGALIAAGWTSPLLLITLLSLGTFRVAVRVYRKPAPKEAPPELPAGVWPLWYVAIAFHHNARFGLFYLLGLIGDTLLVARTLG